MAKQPLNGALQHIRKIAAVRTYRGLSDCDLLERFVGARDEAAFTVLIERHGPMVLGVCRRALRNIHDAEDACQATFLVLASKASSVRKKMSLSSWLHGVACRVAAKLKRDHARRTTRERGAEAPAPRDPAAEVSWREVQAILDEELERLPERSRAPLILCYLECLTRDEAAKQLGLSPTTLYGRLERARNLLRTSLSKRGLTLAAAISATAVGEGADQATLAPTFVVSSTKAATALAAGQPLTQALIGTHVRDLSQEVIKLMFFTKLKLGTAAVLCAGLFMAVNSGTFTSLSIGQDAKPGPSAQGFPPVPTPNQGDAKKVEEPFKTWHEKLQVVNKKVAAQAAAFAYPGAKMLDERAGGDGTLAGSVYQSLYTTPDDLSKVAKWYEHDKKLAGLAARQPGATDGGPDGTRRAVYQDGEQPFEALAKRPVSTRSLLVRTKTYTISVVLCRPPGETLTVILLNYMPD